MRTDEAVAAYRAAIAASPRARMAHSMLAPLLFRTGARNEAADLAARALSLPVDEDPWINYAEGDKRNWPGRIKEVRAALR
jgi:predicted Zn-dependent protease